MLRVNRVVFTFILNKIKSNPLFLGENASLQIPVEIQLAIVLYRLGSSGEAASIRKIAAIFGIGDGGSIDKITKRVFKVRIILCHVSSLLEISLLLISGYLKLEEGIYFLARCL